MSYDIATFIDSSDLGYWYVVVRRAEMVRRADGPHGWDAYNTKAEAQRRIEQLQRQEEES